MKMVLKHLFTLRWNHNCYKEPNKKINLILQEALDKQVISKDECEAMNPDATCAGKFYFNFKVHKPHTNIPPERSSVSQSVSVTSGIGKYVDYRIQEPSKQHNSYLEDTPDFIRRIEKINNEGTLPDNAMIATWDVTNLFTIIPQEEGLECTREALNKTQNKEVSTEFVMRLLEVIFKDSIFQFSDKYYKLNVGTSMGTNPAPSFANIFMAKIYKLISRPGRSCFTNTSVIN